MIKFWFDSPKNRLSRWRDFRKGLTGSVEPHEISEIWDLWSQCPEVSIAIDPYDVKKWPTVWEMIHHGEVCKYSRSLGAAYTIYYLNKSLDNHIMRVFDKDSDDTYLVSLISGEYLMSPKSTIVMDWKDMQHQFTIEYDTSIEKIIDSVLYQVTQ